MQSEIEITRDVLIQNNAIKAEIEAFDKAVPEGKCSLSALFKKCEKFNLFLLANFLINLAPANPEPLIIEEHPGGNLFYNGEIHIKRGFECSGNIICKNLIVDGVLVIGKTHWIWANIDAVEVDLRDAGVIKGKVATYKFRMSGISILMGLIAAKWKST